MISNVGRKVFGINKNKGKQQQQTAEHQRNRPAQKTDTSSLNQKSTASSNPKNISPKGDNNLVNLPSIYSESNQGSPKAKKELEHTYLPQTASPTLNQSNAFYDGLTHEEKTAAITRLNQMERCRTSNGEISIELGTVVHFADRTRKPVQKNRQKLQVQFGYVCQAGYYPESLNKANQDNLLVLANENKTVKSQNGAQSDSNIIFIKYESGENTSKSSGYLNVNGNEESYSNSLKNMFMDEDSAANHTDDRILGFEKEFALFCVFDGHGHYGTQCSTFAAERFLPEFRKILKDLNEFITISELKLALTKTLESVNEQMHRQKQLLDANDPNFFSDLQSGTTAICVMLLDDEIITANVGDSRAVLGIPTFAAAPFADHVTSSLNVVPLSIDQTPFRRDERDRVKKAGAIIMSMDQMDGTVAYDPNQEDWGTEEEAGADPPRLWGSQPGSPGVAFTRSLGDELVEAYGCCASPEISVLPVPNRHSFLCVASDGVFEFLNSEAVCEIIGQFQTRWLVEHTNGAFEAAKALVAESYKLWLHYEVRTDDITAIVVLLDQQVNLNSGADSRALPRPDSTISIVDPSEIKSHKQLLPMQVSMDEHKSLQQRPVRRNFSKEKKRMMRPQEKDEDNDDEITSPDLQSISASSFFKSEQERQAIMDSIQTNFLFQHLTDSQMDLVLNSFEKIPIKKGDTVIQQGEKGDKFYVVGSGTYNCFVHVDSVQMDTSDLTTTPHYDDLGSLVHTYQSTDTGFANPSFGELALMFSAPRAATIIADTDGYLWALNRKVFKKLFVKGSSNQSLVKLLKEVPIITTLSLSQLQRLADVISEKSFKADERIINQGELGDTLYIIKAGTVRCTIDSAKSPPTPSEDALQRPRPKLSSNGIRSRLSQPDADNSRRSMKVRIDLGQQDDMPENTEKEVMRIGPGGYFGERALLYQEPRAASVYAVTRCECLCLSRTTFERLLGPLQILLQKHSKLREAESLANQTIKENFSKLFDLEQGDFGFSFDSFSSFTKVLEVEQEGTRDGEREMLSYTQGVLRHSKKTVTIKSLDRQAILSKNLQDQVKKDRFLLLLCVTPIPVQEGQITAPIVSTENNFTFVARILGAVIGKQALHLVLDVNILATLDDFVKTHCKQNCNRLELPENVVAFIATCIINGIDFLHQRSILSRSIDMSSLQVDESGVVVLTDMTLGKYLEDDGDRAHTICGDPYYFAQEQILNLGADLSVDWWELGLLLYELLYGQLPYEHFSAMEAETHARAGPRLHSHRTSERSASIVSSELNQAERFSLITQFTPADITFQALKDGSELSTEGQKLLKSLLDTDTVQRSLLDNTLKEHVWLIKYCFAADQVEGFATSPLFAFCEEAILEIAKKDKISILDEPDSEADLSWFKPFIYQ